jgi:hypothetical protein
MLAMGLLLLLVLRVLTAALDFSPDLWPDTNTGRKEKIGNLSRLEHELAVAISARRCATAAPEESDCKI